MVDQKGVVNGLDSFSKDYYKGEFIVLSRNENIAGGEWIQIQFQDKPDAIFDIWMYHRSDGYEMRAFFKDPNYTDEQIRQNNDLYAQFLNNKVHAL